MARDGYSYQVSVAFYERSSNLSSCSSGFQKSTAKLAGCSLIQGIPSLQICSCILCVVV